MAVRIRLKRVGKRNRPCYRLAVFDSRTRRDGKVIENLGTYDPLESDETKTLKVNRERLDYWRSKGARLTVAVASLLKRFGGAGQAAGQAAPEPANAE